MNNTIIIDPNSPTYEEDLEEHVRALLDEERPPADQQQLGVLNIVRKCADFSVKLSIKQVWDWVYSFNRAEIIIFKGYYDGRLREYEISPETRGDPDLAMSAAQFATISGEELGFIAIVTKDSDPHGIYHFCGDGKGNLIPSNFGLGMDLGSHGIARVWGDDDCFTPVAKLADGGQSLN